MQMRYSGLMQSIVHLGGSHWRMLLSELCVFYKTWKIPHQTICIVSHGHVSQGTLAILKEGTVNSFPRYAHPNASYSVIDLINGKCIGLKWGIATHLRHLN